MRDHGGGDSRSLLSGGGFGCCGGLRILLEHRPELLPRSVFLKRSQPLLRTTFGLREGRRAATRASRPVLSTGTARAGPWSKPQTGPLRTAQRTALNGADGLSSNNVWAVGYSKAGGAYKTLVERWNGTQWSIVPSPNVGTSHNVLVDVDALRSDLAWAVGYYREGSLRRTLLLRWNGTQWNTVPSPNPGTLSNTLLDVAAIAPNDVWAIGYKSSGAGYQSLILHYNGTNWEEVGAPSLGTGDNVLTSISAVSGTDVWAAGYFVDGTQHKTLTLRYDGTTWHRVPSANAAGGVTALQDIDASSPTSAWAVGFEYQADRNRYVASTQHWNGTSWSAFPSAAQASAGNSEMFAVAKAPGTSQVWAAGRRSDWQASWRPSACRGVRRLRSPRRAPLAVGGADTSSSGSTPSHREAELHTERFGEHEGPADVRQSCRQGYECRYQRAHQDPRGGHRRLQQR